MTLVLTFCFRLKEYGCCIDARANKAFQLITLSTTSLYLSCTLRHLTINNLLALLPSTSLAYTSHFFSALETLNLSLQTEIKEHPYASNASGPSTTFDLHSTSIPLDLLASTSQSLKTLSITAEKLTPYPPPPTRIQIHIHDLPAADAAHAI